MAGIKHEEKIYFRQGHIWVLMDDEWGVEILGEEGIGGDLVGIGSWDFTTREAWQSWGDICIEKIKHIKERHSLDEINEEQVLDEIYNIENTMPESIEQALKTE